jgi:hypothetical protein
MTADQPKPAVKPEAQESAPSPVPRNVPVRTALKAGADESESSGSWFNRYHDTTDG